MMLLRKMRKGIVLYIAAFGDESVQGWLDYVQDMTTEDTFADIGNKVLRFILLRA
ncbi:hypothetical protein AGMMS49573_06230 [Endomicrobiia bacterium]|nr:hypothetical protein AGMMS49573_06230 [Endomicrobiia bacterium]